MPQVHKKAVGERLHIGVIGLRFGTQIHVPAFRNDARCQVIAVAGRDAAKAALQARELDLPESFADWRELVAAPRIDAISIAVPSAAQAAIITEAARHRKHVFCEKPLAVSVAEARQAMASVASARVVHGIDFIFPEIPAWQHARYLLGEGAIGRPVHFAYSWRVQTRAGRTNADTWKNRPEEGGGVLGNFVSHVFHNIEWLLGPIRAIGGFVCSRGPRSGRASDGVVELEGGTTGNLSVCTDAPFGGGHLIEIYGDQSTLVLHNPTADYVTGFRVRLGPRTSTDLAPPEADAATPGVDGRLAPVSRLVRRFVDAIQEGGTMTPNLSHGVRVQELLELAAVSADRLTPVAP